MDREDVISMHAAYRVDGRDVDGFLSRPIEGEWPGVVVLHEWWGLDDHFRALSRRLAKNGFVVLVPDLYHGELTWDWDRAAELKTTLELKTAAREINGGADYLRDLPFVTDDVAIVGFCMGGGLALIALCERDAFDAGVVYYPSMYPDSGQLADVDCPLLFHYGLADSITPRSELDRILSVLDGNDVPYELREYEGADHAFMHDNNEQFYHEEAAEESWPVTVEFLSEKLNR